MNTPTNKTLWMTLTFVVSMTLFSSLSRADSDFQAWNAIALAGPAAEKSPWQYWFDGHFRFKDDASAMGVRILRPAIGYQVNDSLTLWLGVARIDVHGNQDINEERLWQQATFPIASFWGGQLSGRTRLEQRFRDDVAGDTGHRIRQFLRWSRRINDDWSFVVWDELFIGLNDSDWGQLSGFDQNRLYVGPAWHMHKDWRLEVGYMHNYINPPGGADNSQTNHNLAVTIFGTW